MQYKRKHSGFTLAEMAVVVVIAGILLVAGVKILNSQMDRASYSATKSKQEAIKQSLITYLGNNKRLPCPDTRNGNGPGTLSFSTTTPPDGTENRATANDTTSNCAANFGLLPYATLGLARDLAMDGWSNLFSYQLSTTPTPSNWALSNDFSDTNIGNLIINDRDGSGTIIMPQPTTAVAVIVSHGKNGLGAYTIKGTRTALPSADEAENTDGDTSYFNREYTDNTAATGGSFDDRVMYIMADELIAPLRREGTIKGAGARVNQQLDDIRLAIIGSIMNSSCTMPNNLTTDLNLPATPQDPWGENIVYNSAYKGAALPSSGSDAFELTSYGPNKIDDGGSGDDISRSMTVFSLRGLLAISCP